MRRFIDWWLELPSWLRTLVALVWIGVGAAIFVLAGRIRLPTEMAKVAGLIIGIGFGLLLASGRTKSEKNGYRF